MHSYTGLYTTSTATVYYTMLRCHCVPSVDGGLGMDLLPELGVLLAPSFPCFPMNMLIES